MNEETKDSGQVTIPKEQLQGLLQRISALEAAKEVQETDSGLEATGWQEIKEEDRKYIATIRKWRETPDNEWMYAIDWYFHRVERDEKTGEKDLIYRIKWLKESIKGGEKIQDKELVETEMKLPEFIKSAIREKVEISDKEVKKLQKSTGELAEVAKVDYTKYKTTRLGKVPMYVTADSITYKVKLPNGRLVRLKQDRLNA